MKDALAPAGRSGADAGDRGRTIPNTASPSSKSLRRREPPAPRSENPSSRRLPSRSIAAPRPGVDIGRAVKRWRGDGKAQGWSPKTLTDREKTMQRFLWQARPHGFPPFMGAPPAQFPPAGALVPSLLQIFPRSRSAPRSGDV